MSANHYQLDAELTLRFGETLLANSKRIELLRQISLTENLTKSAKIAGYSYKGAWDAIDQMTQLTGSSLLERQAGGKGGGKTRLTPRGKQLLENFLLIQAEHTRFISRLNKLANSIDSNYVAQTEIAMKTSARNQFAGIIVSMLQGPVNDEVILRVNETLQLTSSITHESARDLKLDIGAKVFALIKASSIALRLPNEHPADTARNGFTVTVHRINAGASRTEVIMLLQDGQQLVCTIQNDEAARIGLKPQQALVAVIEASDVIIGIAA
jgi:molybdate transport system regulatory protein